MSRLAAFARTATVAAALLTASAGAAQSQSHIESPESVYYRFMTHLVAGHGYAAADLMTFESRKALRTEIMALTPVRSAKADEIWIELLGANRAALDEMSDREIVGRFWANLKRVNTDEEARALANLVDIGAAQYIEGTAHLYISATVVFPAIDKNDKDDKLTVANIERLVRTQDGWRLVLPTWSTQGMAFFRSWVAEYVSE